MCRQKETEIIQIYGNCLRYLQERLYSSSNQESYKINLLLHNHGLSVNKWIYLGRVKFQLQFLATLLKNPLLCATVCILLLLPLTSLSCTSTKSLKNISEDYNPTIQTELRNAIETINSLLTNSTCSEIKYKPSWSCSSDNTSIVPTLFNITCTMKNRISHPNIRLLTASVENSLVCFCPKPRRGRKRRVSEKKVHKKQGKLCWAKTFLSSLAECFEFLNVIAKT